MYLDVAVIKSNLNSFVFVLFCFLLTGEGRPPRAKKNKREGEMVPA